MVTGGAGYIGAHLVRLLVDRGERVLVVDDLSTGEAGRLAGAVDLETLDLASNGVADELAVLMSAAGVSAVVHLAAKKSVAESVRRPTWYYRQNISGMGALLDAMRKSSVSRFVFSSSAAVYGQPVSGRAHEKDPCLPINPYGQTKLVGEWLARAADVAWGLRQVSLRYFNVAGAGWPDLADRGRANLVPIIVDRLASDEPMQVFGDDYETPDGTCVRDYIHVLDLARAHVDALHYLERQDRSCDVFNVGTGVGSSVLEVIAAAASASASEVRHRVAPRRAGDPAQLVAVCDRIGEVLGWSAEHDLLSIVRSAWLASAGRDPAPATAGLPASRLADLGP